MGDFPYRTICAVAAVLASVALARAQPERAQEPFFGAGGVICVVEHSHSDIAWNWAIDQEMGVRNRNLESVMRQLRADPEFKWTIECVLYLQNWLAAHPEAERETVEFFRRGQLDCGATYTQPFEDCLYGELLARQMYVGKRWFEERHPGIVLSLVANQDSPMRGHQAQQIYAKAGVRYLKGSRMNTPGYFRWVSPDGSSLLAWFQWGYWGRPGINADCFRREMKAQEPVLRVNGLPPVIGITWGHDYNDPVDLRAVIDDWNRKAVSENLPPAKYATFADVLREVEKRGPVNPEVRGGVPNWWVYENWPSHYRAMTAQREAARALTAAETFHAIKAVLRNDFSEYPKEALNRAWTDASYACHTMVPGHNPAPDKIMLHKYLDALAAATNELNAAVAWISQRVKPERSGIPVVVFNRLSWERTDPVRVTIADGNAALLQVADSAGRKVASQIQDEHALVFVAENVPPVGYKTYYLVPGALTEPADAPSVGEEWTRPFQSRFYVITPAEGGIRSIVDRDLGRELVSTDRWLAFEWVAFGTSARGACEGIDFSPHPERFFDRLRKHKVKWTCVESGPVYVRWSTSVAESQHCKVRLSLKVYWDLKRMDVRADVLENDTRTAVEQRLMLPLRCASADIAYEVPFGVVEPGKSEPFVFVNKGSFAPPAKVPTTPREVQDWVYATGDGVGVTVGSSVGSFAFRDFDPEAVRPIENVVVSAEKIPEPTLSVDQGEPDEPAMDLTDRPGPGAGRSGKEGTAKERPGANAKKNGRTGPDAGTEPSAGALVLSPILLACITNPKGACTQPGDSHFDFSIFSHSPGYRKGYKQGIQSRNPLLAVVAASRADGAFPETRSFYGASDANVTIGAIKKAEDDDSVIVRLYDVEGTAGVVRVRAPGPIVSAERTDLLERNGKSLSIHGDALEVDVGSYAVETVRIRSR